MCNLYQLEKSVDAVRRLFAELQIPLEFPEGIPNFQPRDVRITEQAPIVKFDRDRSVVQLVERSWREIAQIGPQLRYRQISGKAVFRID